MTSLSFTSSSSNDCSGTIDADEHKICTITNTQSPPQTGTLKVITHVENNCIGCGGGKLQASNFGIIVSGSNPSPNKFQGSETGTSIMIEPGTYNVCGEDKPFYRGNLSADCAGIIESGQLKTCTITYVSLP
jgi:hypothetical protein